jgi:hypothetical protein
MEVLKKKLCKEYKMHENVPLSERHNMEMGNTYEEEMCLFTSYCMPVLVYGVISWTRTKEDTSRQAVVVQK